jgi:hypothetical protein
VRLLGSSRKTLTRRPAISCLATRTPLRYRRKRADASQAPARAVWRCGKMGPFTGEELGVEGPIAALRRSERFLQTPRQASADSKRHDRCRRGHPCRGVMPSTISAKLGRGEASPTPGIRNLGTSARDLRAPRSDVQGVDAVDLRGREIDPPVAGRYSPALVMRSATPAGKRIAMPAMSRASDDTSWARRELLLEHHDERLTDVRLDLAISASVGLRRHRTTTAQFAARSRTRVGRLAGSLAISSTRRDDLSTDRQWGSLRIPAKSAQVADRKTVALRSRRLRKS